MVGVNRRLRTVVWGAVPVVALAALVSLDHVPGTDHSLTVPYVAEGPGPSFDTLGEVDGQEVIELGGVEEEDTGGQLNMTTVAVRSQLTLAQALGRWLFSDDTLVPAEQVFPSDMTREEIDRSNQVAFSSSEAAATTAALTHLNRPLVVEVAGVLDDTSASGVVEEGDRLLAVDGRKVERPGAVRDAVLEHKPGDEVTLKLSRGGEEREEKVTLGESPEDPERPLLGVLMGAASADGIEVDYNLQDIGGPSAGMIFSLAVIDKLTPGALTGGHFVAGTGTIDEDGSVGEIGGIEHKVRAARDLGAELFLAPAGNCSALAGQDTGDMTVAKVSNLDDAIDTMDDFAAGREVTTCE